MSENDKAEAAPAVTDPRPPSQVEAEEGAREEQAEAPDPRLRAADIASARAYREDGVHGAPGSEADPGGDLPEPYPVTGIRPPSQAAAEDGDPDAAGTVPAVSGATEDAAPQENKDPAGTGPAEASA